VNAREREQLVGQLAARGWVRLVQEVLEEATASYWDRRAATFDAVGTPTADETALACRRHAWLIRDMGLEDDVRELIRGYYTDLIVVGEICPTCFRAAA
jgi:hypothetical protein